MIEAKGLAMRYGSVLALSDSSFRAEAGEVVGLLGPNGAGKTTTMRILTTYQRPSAGTAVVAGFDVLEQPLEVRRRIGYLPEALPLYLDMEVRECLEFVGRARGLTGARLAERIGWVVERCGLERMFRTPCIELSKGYRQRAALAQALVHDPDVVILDEPTSGLDPHQIQAIRTLVRDLAAEKTVLLSTHILQEASALADRLLVMSRGRIVGSGTEEELRRQSGVKPRLHVQFADGAESAAERLEALPGAGSVTAADDANSFEVEETGEGLDRAVGELARAQGWTVLRLEREEGSLEEVFLALTRPRESGEAA